jgi:hypothetical protein
MTATSKLFFGESHIVFKALKALSGPQMAFFQAAVQEGFCVSGVARDSGELERDMLQFPLQPDEPVINGVLEFVRQLNPDDIRMLTVFCDGIEIGLTTRSNLADQWDTMRSQWLRFFNEED